MRCARRLFMIVAVLGALATAVRPAAAATPTAVDDARDNGAQSLTRPATIGDRMFYVHNTRDYGLALFVTDGTATGTRRLTSGAKASAALNPLAFAVLGGALYFVATNDNHGSELWRSDGTVGGTVMVKDIVAGPQSGVPGGSHELVVFQNQIYFLGDDGTSGRELWRTDGTSAGTTRFKDINPGSGDSSPLGLSVVGNALWFMARDGTHGYEPWKSNGNPVGTALVADTVPGAAGSDVYTIFQNLNGKAFFAVSDPDHNTEPWVSDGTAEGTEMIVDLQPGATYAGFLGFGESFGSFVLFRGQDGNGSAGPISGSLWRTDGTAAGTTLVKDIDPDGLTAPFDGKSLFAAADATHGKEPWVTDGTPAGTRMVKDINQALMSGGRNGDGVELFDGAIDGVAYFAGYDGQATGNNGSHLAGIWRTDGTAAGTYALNDNANPSRGFGFTRVNGLIAFMGDSYQSPPGRVLSRIGTPALLTASGPGTPTVVAGFARNSSEMQRVTPYGGFAGGASVAHGDINGDGVLDVIVGAGPGGSPHVQVVSGKDDSVLRSFYAYPANFAGGVFVASADVDGDGRADIVTGAGAGGSPHVQVFSGIDNATIRSFYAYPESFGGGVRVAAGDVNGDGRADVVTGAGAGGAPHVVAFSGLNNQILSSFYAYGASFGGGAYVAAGDLDSDGKAEIVTGAGAGGNPHVLAFSTAGVLRSFYAYNEGFGGGVRVASSDVNGDGRADIVTGAGPGGAPHVIVFSGQATNAVINSFYAYAPSFAGGVFPG